MTIVRDARIEDAFEIANVHVAAWRETYPGLVPASFLERLSGSARAEMWASIILEAAHDPAAIVRVVVERTSGEIVGFASGARSDQATFAPPIVSADGSVRCGAILTALYLLRRAQGAGLGRALFTMVRERFETHALVPFGLWVLVGNPAEAFYRHLGGRAIAEQHVLIDGARLLERGYAFERASTSASGASPRGPLR